MSCKWCPQSQWTLMLRPRICSWHQELHSVGELRWRRPPWSCDILWLSDQCKRVWVSIPIVVKVEGTWSQDYPKRLSSLLMGWLHTGKNQPSTWQMYTNVLLWISCEDLHSRSFGVKSSGHFRSRVATLSCTVNVHNIAFHFTPPLPPWAQPPQSLAPNGRLESLSCCMFLTCLGLFVLRNLCVFLLLLWNIPCTIHNRWSFGLHYSVGSHRFFST